MHRRLLLGTLSTLPATPLVDYLGGLFDANRGRIVRKTVAGREDGSAKPIASADESGLSIRSEADELAADAEDLVVGTEQAAALREAYPTLEFALSVEHYNGNPRTGAGEGEIGRYVTHRQLFNDVRVDDSVSFQTSVFRDDTINAVSCIADDRAGLRPRCQSGRDDDEASGDGPSLG
jgi:hypothetical protein